MTVLTRLFVIFFFTLCPGLSQARDVCDNSSAPVPDIDRPIEGAPDSDWCRIYARYTATEEHIRNFDFRLLRLVRNLEEKKSKTWPDPARVRSIAFLVLNYKYGAEFDKRANDAVATDKGKILNFLTEQHFDEVILLENETATKNNISEVLFWLAKRFDARSQDPRNRTRFLFLYEGHGAKGVQSWDVGSLVLQSDAAPGEVELLDLNVLSGQLKAVAAKATQSTFFLVACFLGGAVGQPPSIGHSSERASIAVAASNHNKPAWLNSDNTGTIFINEFLASISRQKKYYDSLSDVTERLVAMRRGLYSSAEEMNQIFENDPRFEHIRNLGFADNGAPYVWGNFDPFANATGAEILLGDFYFTVPLSNIELTRLEKDVCIASGFSDALACEFADRHDPDWRRGFVRIGFPAQQNEIFDQSPRPGFGSIFRTDQVDGSDLFSLNGLSPRAIFDVPETYAYHGLDASSYSGKIDWEKIPVELRQFVYLRSTQSGSKVDKLFEINMRSARAAGSRVGAYHVVDFCSPAARQFSNIRNVVPADGDLIPLALSVELWDEDVSCQGTRDDRIKLILDLAERASRYYGKQPIFFVLPQFMGEFEHQPLEKFALWVKGEQQPSVRSNAGSFQGVEAQGRAWTIWQYKVDRPLEGVPEKVDFNVFFGGRTDYFLFMSYGANSAGAAGISKF